LNSKHYFHTHTHTHTSKIDSVVSTKYVCVISELHHAGWVFLNTQKERRGSAWKTAHPRH